MQEVAVAQMVVGYYLYRRHDWYHQAGWHWPWLVFSDRCNGLIYDWWWQ
jgi:hypothetical protein